MDIFDVIFHEGGGGAIALHNLTEDFYVCQMPEYDEKRKCPPGPPFLGMVGKGFFSSEAFPKISDLLALSCIR